MVGKYDARNIIEQVVTLYSYDPNGNVEHVYQNLPVMKPRMIAYENNIFTGKPYSVSLLNADSSIDWDDNFTQLFFYDGDSRLQTVHHSFSSGNKKTIDAEYLYYDHNPNLVRRKQLGNYHQGVDYVYTIHGWLKAINHTDYKKDPSSDWDGYPNWRWFADGDTAAGDPGERPNGGSPFLKDGYVEVLHYYEGDFRHNGSPFDDDENNLKGGDLFNGNISAWQEVVAGSYSPTGNPFEGEVVGHTYRYDQMNRLSLTYFNTYDESTDTWSYDGSYDEYLPHDGNGNITGGTRKGVDAGSVVDMDEATFYRNNTSNKLLYITDPHPQYGVASTPPSLTYVYDATGNLIEDPNNNLVMEWNHYNKQTSITDANGETWTFLYDGLGNRVMKTKSGTGPKEMPFYITGKDGKTLARYKESGAAVAVEERYVYGRNEVLGVMSGPNTMTPNVDTLFPFMHYHLYDHLGNVRATVEDTLRPHWPIGDPDPRISSYANYYAYGAPHLNRNYNQADFHHGFNGQERDDDIIGVGNRMNFAARQYDPWAGMFLAEDPLKNLFPSESPYVFGGANPILFVDKNGKKKTLYLTVLSDNAKPMIIQSEILLDHKKVNTFRGGFVLTNYHIDLPIDLRSGTNPEDRYQISGQIPDETVSAREIAMEALQAADNGLHLPIQVMVFGSGTDYADWLKNPRPRKGVKTISIDFSEFSATMGLILTGMISKPDFNAKPGPETLEKGVEKVVELVDDLKNRAQGEKDPQIRSSCPRCGSPHTH